MMGQKYDGLKLTFSKFYFAYIDWIYWLKLGIGLSRNSIGHCFFYLVFKQSVNK